MKNKRLEIVTCRLAWAGVGGGARDPGLNFTDIINVSLRLSHDFSTMI